MVLPSALQAGLGVWEARACSASEYLKWLKDAALRAGAWGLTSVLPVAHCGCVAWWPMLELGWLLVPAWAHELSSWASSFRPYLTCLQWRLFLVWLRGTELTEKHQPEVRHL